MSPDYKFLPTGIFRKQIINYNLHLTDSFVKLAKTSVLFILLRHAPNMEATLRNLGFFSVLWATQHREYDENFMSALQLQIEIEDFSKIILCNFY